METEARGENTFLGRRRKELMVMAFVESRWLLNWAEETHSLNGSVETVERRDVASCL